MKIPETSPQPWIATGVQTDGFINVDNPDGTVAEVQHQRGRGFANAQLIVAAADLRDAATAALLFHDHEVWDDAKRAEWLRLTGSEYATTKVLCDRLRLALVKAGVVLALLLALLLAAPAGAAEVFDRVNDWPAADAEGNQATRFTDASWGIGQPFAVGQTGLLTSVDVAGWGSGPVRLIIGRGGEGASGGLLEALPSAFSGWQEVDLDPPLPVTAGETLGLYLAAADYAAFAAGGPVADGGVSTWGHYVGIDDLRDVDAGASLLFRTHVLLAEPVLGDLDGDGRVGLSDFGVLKANFGRAGAEDLSSISAPARVVHCWVEPTPVPEPRSWGLLLLGAILVTAFAMIWREKA